MKKRESKKLSLRRETSRRLSPMTEDQIRAAQIAAGEDPDVPVATPTPCPSIDYLCTASGHSCGCPI